MMNCLRSSRRLLLSCRPAGAVRTLPSVPSQAALITRYYSRFAAVERPNILGSIRTSLSRHVCRSPARALRRRYGTSDRGPIPRVDRWYHKLFKVATVAALATGATAVGVCSRYDREIVPYTNRTHLVFVSPQSEIELWEPHFIEDKKIWASRSQMVDPLHPDSVRVRLIADKVLRATYRTLDIETHKDVHDTHVMETQKDVTKTGAAQPQTRHLDGLKWEVILIKDDEETTTECTPGGKIIVYTGFLEHFKTDAEIAFAVAHEVGHIVARHKADIAYTKWFPVLLWLPFFRKMELEADHIGMLLLAAAGFHPNNALKFLWKQAKIDGPSTVFENFIAAYPSDKKRMERLSEPEVMEKAMKLYREATPDQGIVRQAAYNGFFLRETLGDICNIISTRLREVLRGRSTN